CCRIPSLNIPASVHDIASWAFSGCGFTGSLTIPESVTSIGENAFADCSGFTGSLTIPESVTDIGRLAFAYCSGFTSLTIPESITEIGVGIFGGCSGFTSLTIPESITYIDSEAFANCSGFTGSLTIPESVTEIGAYAFYGCSGFTSLTIPESFTSIAYAAFADCSGFTSLTIPESVTGIEHLAFQGCSGFTGPLTIPESVTWIGDEAFSGCSGFTGPLTIPESVLSIGSRAFADCSGFTGSLTLGSGLKKLGNTPFYGCNFDEVISLNPIPPTTSWDYEAADVFTDANRKAPLTVPAGSEAAYMASPVWWGFKLAGVEATGITLSNTALTLTTGATAQLSASITPENATYKSVTWSSSDTEVATVSEVGVVTALKAGSATITVSTVNGLKATCTVTVTPKPSGIEGVDGDGVTPVSVESGEIVISGDAEAEVYSLTGARVAVATGGRVSGLPQGIYLVRTGGKTYKLVL
ncbi:MAG: leucine-rich repeat protein, partial [Paramuribaculum sp.]|nr:leucine-rich repeat protein [Paramuribaculum sp.]